MHCAMFTKAHSLHVDCECMHVTIVICWCHPPCGTYLWVFCLVCVQHRHSVLSTRTVSRTPIANPITHPIPNGDEAIPLVHLESEGGVVGTVSLDVAGAVSLDVVGTVSLDVVGAASLGVVVARGLLVEVWLRVLSGTPAKLIT